MRVTEGLDAGPVALQEEVAIDPADDYGSLSERLAELGGTLALRALDARAAGTLGYTEQDEERATYAEKIDPGERHLDPGEPAAALARKVRALRPHVGTYIELEGGGRLGVLHAAATEAGPAAGSLEPAADALALGTAEGTLRLQVVQPPGKRPMDAEAYLRGHEAPARAL
jgi:methionyl-tRNA formyltransferase